MQHVNNVCLLSTRLGVHVIRTSMKITCNFNVRDYTCGPDAGCYQKLPGPMTQC